MTFAFISDFQSKGEVDGCYFFSASFHQRLSVFIQPFKTPKEKKTTFVLVKGKQEMFESEIKLTFATRLTERSLFTSLLQEFFNFNKSTLYIEFKS